jgi:XTP/dITP diphosphohydrolase
VRVVLASGNRGKLRELSALLAPLGVELVPQADLGIEAPEEPHATFVENALVKARHASALAGIPAIADDSGLCVDALNGAPGVRSARFAGPDATDADNNARLIEALGGTSERRAHYDCVMVFIRRPDDPAPLIATGRWHGHIVDVPRGCNGFGYDPHFVPDGVPDGAGRTAAELPPELKNRISHRGQASASLVALLRAADPGS